MLHPALRQRTALLRPKVVAEIFGVQPQTLVDWETAGHLTAERTLGGQRRYHATSVNALLATRERAA